VYSYTRPVATSSAPHFWVVEPEAVAIVRRIYQMALDGYGLAEVAAALERDGVFNPAYYWRSNEPRRFQEYRGAYQMGPYYH